MATTSSSRLIKKAESYRQSVKKNMVVFTSLSQKLSTGQPEEYVDAACTLTNWLSSDKAYYPEAREHIVTMLEAASQWLMRGLHLSPTQEFHTSMCKSDVQRQVSAYTALVHVVELHLERFSDGPLKSRLVNVFSTIRISRPSKETTMTSSFPSTINPDEQAARQRTSATGSTTLGVSTSKPESALTASIPTGSSKAGTSKQWNDANPTTPYPVLPAPSDRPSNTSTSQLPKDAEKVELMTSMLAEKSVRSNMTHKSSHLSPRVPHTSANMPDSSNTSSMTPQAAQTDPLQQPVSQTPILPITHLSAQSVQLPTSAPAAAAFTKPPDPKHSPQTLAGRRPSYHSKFMQLAAIDLKSYKRTQPQPKFQHSNDGKGIRFPQDQDAASASSESPVGTHAGLHHSSEEQSGTASEYQSEERRPEPATIPQSLSEAIQEPNDKDTVTPDVRDAPASQDSLRNRTVSPSTPTVNSELGGSAPQAGPGRPSYRNLPLEQKPASMTSEQLVTTSVDGPLQVAVSPLVAAPSSQLPGDKYDQQAKSATTSGSISLTENDMSRNVAPQQPPQSSAEAPTTRVNHDTVPTLAQSSNSVLVNVVASAPGATRRAENLTVKDSEYVPSDHFHETQQQKVSVDTQSIYERDASSTPGRKSAGAWSENMEISATPPPASSLTWDVTAQNADKMTSGSSTVHPSVFSAVAPPPKEPCDTLSKAKFTLPRENTPEENTNYVIPEREENNLFASPQPSVLQMSGLPAVETMSVSEIPEDADTTMLEEAQIIQSISEAKDGVAPPGTSHYDRRPAAWPDSDNQASTKATSDENHPQDDVSNDAAAPSGNGKLTGHLTILAKHFLRAHDEEEQRHRVPRFVQNVDKMISSLPHQTVQKIVQVAKESRATSLHTAPGQEEAGKVSGRTEQAVSPDGSQTRRNDILVSETSGVGLDNAGSTESSHDTKKRRRSESLDQMTGSERPSSRSKMGDIVPPIAETKNGDPSTTSLATIVPAQEPPPIVPRRSENLALADASNLAPKVVSILASITDGDDSITAREKTVENVGNVKQHQRSSPSATEPYDDDAVSRRDLRLTGLDDHLVLGQLSYHPIPPFQIVTIIEGSATSHVHEVELELDEHQAAMVTRWNDRHTNYDRTAPCITITLICARLAEVEAWSERNPGTNAEEATRNMQIQWPADGGLWITLQRDNSAPASLPLSPPSNIKINEPIDLSPNIGPRTTKIRLIQTTNLSDFVFVIRAHRPTEAQLREFLVANHKMLAWRDTLSRLSVPFKQNIYTDVLAMLKPAT